MHYIPSLAPEPPLRPEPPRRARRRPLRLHLHVRREELAPRQGEEGKAAAVMPGGRRAARGELGGRGRAKKLQSLGPKITPLYINNPEKNCQIEFCCILINKRSHQSYQFGSKINHLCRNKVSNERLQQKHYSIILWARKPGQVGSHWGPACTFMKSS